jgi:uncharacterized coiled-coil protein SlyX
VKPSLSEEAFAPLNAQIERTQAQLDTLKADMGVVDAELEKFATARQRMETLKEVCTALDKLEELKAGELFWKGITESGVANGHLKNVRARISRFEERIGGVLEKQASLQEKIDRQRDELDFLYDELNEAREREQRRKEEFVIEREISEVPFREMIMPWTMEAESERRFRRALLVSLLVCIIVGSLVRWITVPVPDRSVEVVEIPERLAKLVKNEPPIPVPQPKPKPQPKEEAPQPEDIAKPKPDKPKKDAKPDKAPKKVAAKKSGDGKKPGGGKKAARQRAERSGVLAFKKSFSDLMDETPIAKLGTEARISKESPRVAGQAVAQRSLVAVQAKGGSSGGIRNAKVSRNVGSGAGNGLGGSGIGRGGASGTGAGFARVDSNIADLEEQDRPLSDGPGPGRTDEEIQIVFDRYKATLYRIYNSELRKDPTLRGKILLRISIESSGAVSMCKVESTDLASPELVTKIVARIKRFNFGPKEGVPKMTILYPIDFLPAG